MLIEQKFAYVNKFIGLMLLHVAWDHIISEIDGCKMKWKKYRSENKQNWYELFNQIYSIWI